MQINAIMNQAMKREIEKRAASYRNFLRGSDDPPPCLNCSDSNIVFCEMTGKECKAFEEYTNQETDRYRK